MNKYGKLLRRSLTGLLVCLAAVLVCYLWIDRPVAFFAYRHHLNEVRIFRWLTYPPPQVQTWSPLILTVIAIRRARGPLAHWRKVLLVACVSLIVTDQFRVCLGDICGRYWPETWFHGNPSLIGNGTYGFHPFQDDDEVGSFPSGHATRILSFVTVWWLTTPRSRHIGAVISIPMLMSLVLMDYHFVGDVIAGAFVGAIIAAYAVHLAKLQNAPADAR
ncbi:MAG: phosphatase PAP2 family protein [Chthoniobacterales bacterium]|nr:phosphatase PAP2 family protein [Chthoniobacterales bacterium]